MTAAAIVSLEKVEASVRLAAEVCVIGSGPAGGFVAVALAAAGHDVLVLEAGGDASGDGAAARFGDVDIPGQTGLQFGRAIQLGGSSNLWAGRVTPLQPIDFESRSWVPESGWPISASELEPYYQRVREILGVAAPQAPELWIPASTSPSSAGLEMKISAWSRPPFNIGDYLRKRADVGRLRILLHAPVLELKQAASSMQVNAAVLGRRDGSTMDVTARLFVLAAGGVENPRILMNSRSRSPSGLGNEHDQVGRYFSTHPKADMATLHLDRAAPVAHPLLMDREHDGVWMRAGLGFNAHAQRAHSLLNHCAQLSPFAEYKAAQLFERMQKSEMVRSPLIDRSAIVSNTFGAIGRKAFNLIGRAAGLQRHARVCVLRAFMDQYPNAENRVSLSDEVDAWGLQKPRIRWRFSNDDRCSVVRFFSHMDTVLRSSGVGHVKYQQLEALQDWDITGIHSHFMGGTRMGSNPSRSVVDKNCRVHASANLFVAGPSLFPSYGYANPFLTIGALSLRLADTLTPILRDLR